jgi:hypothetical protein
MPFWRWVITLSHIKKQNVTVTMRWNGLEGKDPMIAKRRLWSIGKMATEVIPRRQVFGLEPVTDITVIRFERRRTFTRIGCLW